MADQVEEGELRKVEAMIQSMTRRERTRPDVIDKSRAGRIARGCGRKPKDVLDLVQRFKQMRELMGSLGKPGGLLSRIPGLGQMGGGLPGGGLDPSALLAGAGGPGVGYGPAPRARGPRADQARKSKRQQARKARQKGRTRGKKKRKK
jgi:signal recognition particle subunit SRP54